MRLFYSIRMPKTVNLREREISESVRNKDVIKRKEVKQSHNTPMEEQGGEEV
jgi:hypothetical protein